ncbi:type II toxin-antitoxin system VapB family antitoxin [Paracoccus tegillarcae]|uniref:Histidinol dehydrogenase n=1 Tax=Paracoccus tegillarcae TaxID=1529068 RepID=A0A2K9F1C4_9RHOB|nr:type II toxin-antitoxin system VapB family antitoxin [Paracoccus tegillarcae]AUH35364.1 histidinol dehydrogenase [Paracoccus tegillarcae]
MPLYIRDDTVDVLVEQYMRVTENRTKTEAVRQALQDALNYRDRRPLAEKIKPLQARIAKLGPIDPNFDMRSFTDEL